MKWLLILSNIYLGLCLAQYQKDIVDEEKCNKLGGPGTYEKLKTAVEKSRTCISEVFDMGTFQREINIAGTAGMFDNFIPKYENSLEDVSLCLKDYVETAELCLTKKEKKDFYASLEKLRRVVRPVYGNGIQEVIEFMEKGGIGCVPSRIGAITMCYIDNSPCKDFESFKSCIVQGLQNNCTNTISANITEQLLEYIKSSMCTDNKLIRNRRSLRRIARGIKGMEDHLPHIKKTVKKKCYLNEETDQKLEENLEKAEKCIKEKEPFITKKDEYLVHLDKCTNSTVKMFTDCLPEKLKYIPKLLLDIVHSLVSFLYDDFYIIDEAIGPCMGKLNTSKSETNYDECVFRVKIGVEIPTSKEEFCNHFIALSGCLIKQLNETCEHSDKLDTFSKDYVTAMERPCKSTK